MKYSIFKLEFFSGVHFGRGILNNSGETFSSDMLFSALYIEALKMGVQEALYQAALAGKLLFSDAFPYVGDQYMLPKPMLYIESAKKGDSEEKKKYKALKYFPAEDMEAYLAGKLNLDKNPMKEFGYFSQRTMAAVRRPEDTLPFQVGEFYYKAGNGLYVIVAYEETSYLELAESLLEAVSYTGIGGKKSEGLGRFVLKHGTKTDKVLQCFEKRTGRYMLLSTALATDEELESALDGASYLLTKRSGFIASDTYALEARRKRDLFVFASGSCFVNRFSGDIFDVSIGGGHPVYRYAKSLFVEV